MRDPTGDGAPSAHLAVAVAAEIEGEVVARGWPVGLPLGSEAQLARRFGVGRQVLREAMRLLEHRGVCRVQRGRGGGLVVSAPSLSSVTSAMAVRFDYTRTSPAELFEALAALQVPAVEEVGSHATVEVVEELRAVVPPTDVELTSWQAASRFHLTIARLTGNPVTAMLVTALSRLTPLWSSTPVLVNDPAVRAATVVELHRLQRDVVERMAGGDVDGAARLMGAHLQAAGDWPGWEGRSCTVENLEPLLLEGAHRRADAVAWAIHARIRDAGWPTGDVIGSQDALCAEFGVGRAVLREAMRILEHHSIARMQKGAKGGVVVMGPDDVVVVDTASRYLRYLGASDAHLDAARRSLALGAVRAAAHRASGTNIDRLRAMAAEPSTDPDAFHLEVVAMAGNRVLLLLCNILTAELRHRHPRRGTPADRTTVDDRRRRNLALVDALARRDEAAAVAAAQPATDTDDLPVPRVLRHPTPARVGAPMADTGT